MSDIVERLVESAGEVQEFPHPSQCDHLHVAPVVMLDAANEIERLRAEVARLTAERDHACAELDGNTEYVEGHAVAHSPGLRNLYTALLASVAAAERDMQAVQRALAFWIPRVPADDSDLAERAASDAWLLTGYDGPSEQCAEELGWIRVAKGPEAD